jgi:hypothetical protein
VARVGAVTSSPRPLLVDSVDGATFLRFVEASSYDATDESRIKSQYEKELMAGAPGFGAVGISGCGQLVAAASFGTVPLPRSAAVSVRIDVVVTAHHVRGLGLARAAIAHLVRAQLGQHGDHLEHLSVVAVHPLIRRIVESLGFVDAAMRTSSPVLHRTIDRESRVSLRLESDRQATMAFGHLKTECARCQLRRRGPWCAKRPA